MKVVNQNAVAALFEKVEELNNQSRDGWQCLYFKIPDAREAQNHVLNPHFDVNIIVHMLAKSKGTIYQCDNGDLFILHNGSLRGVEEKLSSYFWALYPDQMIKHSSNHLFSVFDVSKQWMIFSKLCESRYLEALASSEPVSLFYYTHSLTAQRKGA